MVTFLTPEFNGKTKFLPWNFLQYIWTMPLPWVIRTLINLYIGNKTSTTFFIGYDSAVDLPLTTEPTHSMKNLELEKHADVDATVGTLSLFASPHWLCFIFQNFQFSIPGMSLTAGVAVFLIVTFGIPALNFKVGFLIPALIFKVGLLALVFMIAWSILLAPALALILSESLAFGAATFLAFKETFTFGVAVFLTFKETFGIFKEIFGVTEAFLVTLTETLAVYWEQTDFLSVAKVQATSVYPAQQDEELGMVLALTAARADETAVFALMVKTKLATEVTSPWIFGIQ